MTPASERKDFNDTRGMVQKGRFMAEYYDIERRQEIKEKEKRLRRKFLTYKEAELIYSMQHKKLMELADRAGALYRVDGLVLINRDIFDVFLENFHQPPLTRQRARHPKNRHEIAKNKKTSESEDE